NSFGMFGESTLPEMFPDGLLDDAEVKMLTHSKSSWIENLGNGKFKIHELPMEAQMAPIFGILPTYLDEDNLIDLLLVGNDFGVEVQQGRSDALIGLALKNKGNGGFEPITLENSHFFVPKDGKGLVNINLGNEKLLFMASQNNDYLKVFEHNSNIKERLINAKLKEIKAELRFHDGSIHTREFYWGSTFQSQSSRSISL